MKHLLKILALLLFVNVSYSQNEFIDSLKHSLTSAKNDSVKAEVLIALANEIIDDKVWPVYNNKAYQLAEQKLITSPNSKHYLGVKAFALTNFGYLEDDKGNTVKALEHYQEALDLHKKINNTEGIASVLNNIGSILYDQKQYDEALKYYNQSVELKKENNDKEGIAWTYNNIGTIYEAQEKVDEAILYYRKSLHIMVSLANPGGQAITMNNLGALFLRRGEYKEAISYIRRANKQYKIANDESGVAWTYGNLSHCFYKQGMADSTMHYAKKSYEIASKLDYPAVQIQSIEKMYDAYALKGDYKQALNYHIQWKNLQDTIENTEKQKEVLKKEMQYHHEKEKLKLEQDKQQAAAIAKEKEIRSYWIIGAIILILLIVVVFSGLLFNRFKLVKQQKAIIEKQKVIVEETNREIVDSINYAKRLQDAILPPHETLQAVFQNFFIYYQPKDIVAGDFYWMEEIKGETFFAVADCTGHGVPGSIVSVVCSNAINRAVKEFELKEPAQILDKVTDLVIETFDKSGEEVKDGMDISFIKFNKDFTEIAWAGANNPLWIIRNNELIETKADKQPIGKFAERSPFTNHKITLQKNDTLYLFTDGYADQFGGEKGKKFKSGNLKQLLLSIQNKTMEEQKKYIIESFENWKGNLEQVDDVCIMGIRV